MRTRTTLFAPAALVAALSIASLAGCSGTGSDSASTAGATSSASASVSYTHLRAHETQWRLT